MNDSELEQELRSLLPAVPSAGLEARIARELAGSARELVVAPRGELFAPPRWNFWEKLWPGLGWATAGAAAVWVTMTVPLPFAPKAAPVASAGTHVFEPAGSESEVLSAEEGNVVFDAQQGPTQVVRYSSVERQRWSNPVTGASLEIETPREDVFVVPVSYQ